MGDILSCLSVEIFLKYQQIHCALTCYLNLLYLRLACLSHLTERRGMGQYCQRGECNTTNLIMRFGLHLSNVCFATALHYMYAHCSTA